MTREEIDKALLDFIHEQKSRDDRQEWGLYKAVGDVAAQVTVLGQKIDANYTITAERISGLASRVQTLEKDAEDTGINNIKKLEAELAEKKAKEARQLEQRGSAVVRIVGQIAAGIVLLVLGALATHLMWK